MSRAVGEALPSNKALQRLRAAAERQTFGGPPR